MCHGGDEQEATEFISQNRGVMMRIAMSRLRQLGHPDPPSYADDVVAVASAKLVKNWATLYSPMGALCVTTKNVATTFARKYFGRRELELEATEAAGISGGEPGGSPEQIFERAESLEFAMRGLNKKERVLLELRYYGMAFEEIAAATKTSVGTLTSMYTRALKKMRKTLEAAQASTLTEPAPDPAENTVRRGELRNPLTAEG